MSLWPTFKLPAIPPARRPRDLLYAENELPPTGNLLVLTLQHAATALTLIAYVLASAKIAGLDTQATQSMVTATVLGMAIATFLQSWGGRLGSGLLIVHIPDPLLVMVCGLVAAEFGLGGLVIVTLVNGVTALCTGAMAPRLRAVLPPIVAGVVICIAGLSLIPSALEHSSGLNDVGDVDTIDMLLGGSTLFVMIGLSVWGNRRAKLFALLAGLLTGVLLAYFFDRLHGLETLTQAPLLGLPALPTPSLDINPSVLLAIVILAVMTQLDTFGTTVLLQRMNDADFKRPDMRRAGASFRAGGLGNILSSFLGAYPSATSSANIALAHISRSTSRYLGITTAIALACIAFLPKVTLLLTLIPTPVIGAVEMYAAAYLIVSGIELIASRALDTRSIFMVGISFIAGVGVMILPQLPELAPESVRFLAQNGIIVGGLCAIGMNLVFRLGTARKVTLTLSNRASDDPPISRQLTDFIEENGAMWGARRDAIRRAAQATLEASEHLAGSNTPRPLIAVTASFDEFNLDIDLIHEGPPIALEPPKGAQASLLSLEDNEFDLALEHAINQASAALMRRLADRIHSRRRGQNSVLRLHFDH